MANTLLITRAEVPAVTPGHDQAAAQQEFGGQWEWCWAMAYPYRVLAAPRSGLPMPAAPATPGRHPEVDSSQSYWATLRSFLTFSFGWTRHDKGLVWWYEAGRPTDDPRFALLNAVWERDGLLDRYLAWCLERQTYIKTGLEPWASQLDPRPAELNPGMADRLRRAHDLNKTGVASPEGNHLEWEFHVAGAALGEVNGELMVVPEVAPPRAVLICRSAAGWYKSLVNLGSTLPASPQHAWRIEVFVRPIGLVGTFRRSWRTGLWFSGQHRYHEVGN